MVENIAVGRESYHLIRGRRSYKTTYTILLSPTLATPKVGFVTII